MTGKPKLGASGIVGFSVGLATFISVMTWAVKDINTELPVSSRSDRIAVAAFLIGSGSAVLGIFAFLGADKIEEEIKKKKHQNNQNLAAKNR